MDTYNLIKTLRYYFAADATMRTLLGVATAQLARAQLRYSDSNLAQVTAQHSFPCITLKIDDDDPIAREIPTNTIYLTATVWCPSVVNNYAEKCIKLKDRLNYLLKKTAVNNVVTNINTQATTLGLTSVKVHDAAWVGAVTYDDKTQGTERLHKIICTARFILGD